MAKSFGIVLVYGFTDLDPRAHDQSNAREFLSWRFPSALIHDFGPLPLTTPKSDCYLSIHERATSILEGLLDSSGPQKDHREGLQLIFLGHGLGGLLVKHLLLVATKTSRYHAISKKVVGAFFIETPHRAATLVSWERYLVRVIAASGISHGSPRQLLEDLPRALSEDAEAFACVSWPFAVVDIFQQGQENALYHVGSSVSRSSLLLRREQNIELSTSTTSTPLDFSSGRCEIQSVCDGISALFLEDRQPIQTELSEFLSKLLMHNLDTPFLDAESSVLTSDDVVLRSSAYQEWINTENADFSVLHVDGLSKSRSKALERTALETLLGRQTSRPSLLLNSHFHENVPNNQTQAGVLVSLCRQLFLARPALYTHAQPMCSFMLEQHLYSQGLLMNLFKTLVLNCTDVTIYCIIHLLDHPQKPLGLFIDFISGLSHASRGGLQVLFTDEKIHEHVNHRFNNGICRHVSGWANTETSTVGMDDFIHENARRIASSRNLWKGSEDVFIHELSSVSTLEAMRRLARLETAEMRSTRKATWEQIHALKCLEPLPDTRSSNCGANNRYDWLQAAFRWILHAFRPLTTSELAAAVAFGEFGIKSGETLVELMPHDIAGDLVRTAGQVIKIVKDRVVPVHKDICQQYVYDADVPLVDQHFSLLTACLQYIQYAALLPFAHREKRSPDYEHSLLSYASANWLLHYKAVSSELAAQARTNIFEFLGTKDCLALCIDRFRESCPECPGHLPPTSRLEVISYLGLVELLDLETAAVRPSPSLENDINEALEKAALNGEVETIDWLIGNGARSKKALGFAAMGGHVLAMRKITSLGAQLNETDENGFTALHHAACHGALEALVFLLIEDRSMLNSITSRHGSALCLAAKLGHTDCVECLVIYEADGSIQDSYGYNALALAAKGGFIEILDILLQSYAKLDHATVDGNTLLHLAAQFGHLQVVDLLLRYFPEVHVRNKENITPLYMAVEGGFLDVVQLLLKAVRLQVDRANGPTHNDAEMAFPADTQRTPNTISIENPLKLAVERDDCRIVEALLENRAQSGTELDGDTLLTAVATQSSVIVELLLAYIGQDFLTVRDVSGNSILHQAAKRSDPEVLSLLLNRAPSDTHTLWNEPNKMLWTPLHVAADLGHVLVVKVLLRRMIDVDAQTEEEDTALNLAVRKRHSSVVFELLKNSMADVKICNQAGEDALNLAVKQGSIDIIQSLFTERPDLGCVLHHDTILSNLNAPLSQADEKGSDKNQDEMKPPSYLPVEESISPAIEILSKYEADINAQNASGMTPVCLAAKKGFQRTVKLLVQKGANLNLPDNENKTPLYHASFYGCTQVVEEILDASPTVEVNFADNRNWTPLHAAYDHADITRLLLSKGATPDSQTSNTKSTPLAMAANGGYHQVVALHLEANADPNIQDDDGETVLHRALGEMEVVKLLIDHPGTKLDESRNDNSTPLHLAASNEDITEIAHLLLDRDVDLHKKSDVFGTVLIAAAIGGDTSLVKRLVEKQCAVNEECMPYNTALQAAAYHGQLEVVEWLIANEADINIIGGRYGSALCAAIASRSRQAESIIQTLLKKRAKVRDEEVLMAFEGDMATAAELLINHLDSEDENDRVFGALNRDKFGRSFLSNAILSKRYSIFNMLLNRSNMDFNSKDNAGRTPLMFAAMSSDQQFLKQLLEKNPDTNARDSEGKTALMHACIMDASDAVKALVEHADTSIADYRGRQALYWATRRSSIDVFGLVEQAMVTPDRQYIDNHLCKAMHAAIASNRISYIDRLLKAMKFPHDIEEEPDDGWTLLYTVQRYGFETMEERLLDFLYWFDKPNPRLPSAWSKFDKTPCLRVDEDGQGVSVSETCLTPGYDWNSATMGTLRANYPITPIDETEIYYFEVKIEENKAPRSWAIGFCDGDTELNLMLGWGKGSWGYHADDGAIYAEGRPYAYGKQYDTGDEIGCGINFRDKSAFFTRNGQIIGKAFENIAGKLYPAVSVDQGMVGAKTSVKFWKSGEDVRQKFDLSDSRILEYPETRVPLDSDTESIGDTFQLDITLEKGDDVDDE